MNNLLKNYKNSNESARKHIFELLDYAINYSDTGNSIVYVDTLELANTIQDIINDELADYILDLLIYEDGNYYAIDCLFNGELATMDIANQIDDLKNCTNLSDLNSNKNRICAFIDELELTESITYTQSLQLLEILNSIYEQIKEDIFRKILFG